MITLVINSGSSSIKYQLLDMPEGEVLCAGLIERIGEKQGRIAHEYYQGSDFNEILIDVVVSDHRQGMEYLAGLLTDPETGPLARAAEVELVGHRVVHGGETFTGTVIIDREVEAAIEALSDLAPLHNPPNLTGIRMSRKVFARATQVAVFDTAFHQTLPPYAYRYAIPEKYYREHGIRVYGFHGTSHRYIAREAASILGRAPADTSLITIHLGNGASMAAIKNGKSIDTTLGMTPLPGLVMGTRSGDIDPAVVFYLHDHLNMSVREINRLLNKESGMKGLTGHNDLRQVISAAEAGERQARLALEIYAYRIKKYIGAYTGIAGPVQALVFTGGVGQNSPLIRQMATDGLQHLGIELDREANVKNPEHTDISLPGSRIKVLVIPTNEELEIARQAWQLVSG